MMLIFTEIYTILSVLLKKGKKHAYTVHEGLFTFIICGG